MNIKRTLERAVAHAAKSGGGVAAKHARKGAGSTTSITLLCSTPHHSLLASAC